MYNIYIYISIYLSIYLSTYLSIYLSIYLYRYLYWYLYLYLYLYLNLSMYFFIRLNYCSICLFYFLIFAYLFLHTKMIYIYMHSFCRVWNLHSFEEFEVQDPTSTFRSSRDRHGRKDMGVSHKWNRPKTSQNLLVSSENCLIHHGFRMPLDHMRSNSASVQRNRDKPFVLIILLYFCPKRLPQLTRYGFDASWCCWQHDFMDSVWSCTTSSTYSNKWFVRFRMFAEGVLKLISQPLPRPTNILTPWSQGADTTCE